MGVNCNLGRWGDMANYTGHFVDSPVFIYDTGNNLIARTKITGYGKDEKYIEVADGLKNVKPGTRLQLIIIHSTGASELGGVLKSVRQGIFEISIYGEKEREVRNTARRVINASAVISDMVCGYETRTPSEPLPVVIVDMSTTGILINSGDSRLDMGTLLQVEFTVSKKTCILYGEIVRERADENGAHEYGCKLYFF